jgi:phosphate transport system protein
MSEPTTGHIVRRFDGEMMNLHQLVLEMGGLVIDQIQRVIKALDDESPEEAREVVERDRLVNDLDIRVDEEVVKLLARRQPMAGDLRAIMTVAKSVVDLERVGDQTRKVALLVEHLYGNGPTAPNPKLLEDIHRLATTAIGLLRTAVQAFDQFDAHKAVAVIQENQKLEAEFQSSLRRLTTFVLEDHRTIGHMVDAVLGLRALERIGGHAKNIAGYVIYLCTGRDVRHADLATIAAEILAERQKSG